MTVENSTDEIVLLNVREVAAFVRLSRPTIYARLAKNAFPKPIYPSPRCPRWRRDELRAWVNELSTARAA